jgi:hypothetical protein
MKFTYNYQANKSRFFLLGTRKKKVNRIAFFIWEERTIDYYKEYIKKFNPGEVSIVFNDYIKKSVPLSCLPKSWSNAYDIIPLSEAVHLNYIYKVGISTGFQAVDDNTSFVKIIARFVVKLYAITLENPRLSDLIMNKLNKDISSNQILKRFMLPPERKISETLIYFPRGLDVEKDHPGDMRSRFFDSYLCHSYVDQKYIYKNTGKPTYVFGYPRYNLKSPSDDECRKKLIKEFNLPENKEIIIWTPSRVDWQLEVSGNITTWLKTMSKVSLGGYSIICRPHPHQMKNNSSLINSIKSHGIMVDLVESRAMSELYRGGVLTFADYGGTIFSSIYCKRPVILLNLLEHYQLAPNSRTDVLARKYLTSIDPESEKTEKIEKILNCIHIETEKMVRARSKLFIDKDDKLLMMKSAQEVSDMLI